MKYTERKDMRWLTGALLVSVLFAGVWFSRDALAETIWKHARWSTVALFLNTNNAELALSVGRYNFSQSKHDLEMAERAFRQALVIDPLTDWAHFELARIAFIRGNFSAALYEINRQIALHPENKRAHYLRGLVYGYRGFRNDFARAEEDFAVFVEWSPHEWAGYNDLAWIQVKRARFSEARDTILQAFENNPWTKERTPWLWSTLGSAYLSLGENEHAVEAFSRALALTEDMAPTYFWSAYPGNDARNAKAGYQQYRASLYFNLGLVYERIEEWERARNAYQAYLAILPEGPFPKQYEIEEKIHELSAQLY